MIVLLKNECTSEKKTAKMKITTAIKLERQVACNLFIHFVYLQYFVYSQYPSSIITTNSYQQRENVLNKRES